MRWGKTTASECRYGECAEALFGDGDVIWEDSEADYQGHAKVLVALRDGRFAHYEWWYGSCSGCDTWEAEGLSHEAIVKQMQEETVYFDNAPQVRLYLQGDGFKSARKAFEEWELFHE